MLEVFKKEMSWCLQFDLQIILDMVERGKEGMKREKMGGNVMHQDEEDVGARSCIILSLFP